MRTFFSNGEAGDFLASPISSVATSPLDDRSGLAGVAGFFASQAQASRPPLKLDPAPQLVLLNGRRGFSLQRGVSYLQRGSRPSAEDHGGANGVLRLTATKQYEPLHLLGSRAPWIEFTPVCEVGSNSVFEITLPQEPFWRAPRSGSGTNRKRNLDPGSPRVRRVMQARSWRVWNARDWDSVQYTDWTLVQELIPTVPMVPGRNQNLPNPAEDLQDPCRGGTRESPVPLSSRP